MQYLFNYKNYHQTHTPKNAMMVTVDHHIPDLIIELIHSPYRVCYLLKLKIINLPVLPSTVQVKLFCLKSYL